MFRQFLLPLTVCVVSALAAGAAEQAQKIEFFPLKDVKPGMKAVGRTVFSGDKVEEFQVEILGVLRNVGPQSNIILARLSGGPLEKTGVMAGMSGSPVYIDGKLAGAVALSFPFSKEPIAGITPIEQMARVLEKPQNADTPAVIKVDMHSMPGGSGTPEPRLVVRNAVRDATQLAPALPEQSVTLAPGTAYGCLRPDGCEPRLMRIATPLVMSGFTSRALEQFTPQLQALGLTPMQGGGGGTGENTPPSKADLDALQPGSMISVQLIRGDLGVNADGTVTYRDGNRIYAFGHRFLASGPTEMPFSTSNVITLLGSTFNSFKISTPGKPMGVIRQDRASGVLGALGEQARMIPVNVRMRNSRSQDTKYKFEIVNDRFLSPFLLQMALFSTMDSTERTLGEASLAVVGTIAVKGQPPVKIENMFAADAMTPMLTAQVSAVPLALLLQSGFPIDIAGIDLEIFSADQKRQATLDQVWSSRREVKPGEKLEITTVLRTENGGEVTRTVAVDVPASLTPGPLQITVADGASLNLTEVRELPGGFSPKTPAQLIRAINNLRKNNRLYVRLSRPGTAFLLHGTQFPSPPPSVAQVMANDPSASTNVSTARVSTLAEAELEALPSVVSGSKTITVNVKY